MYIPITILQRATSTMSVFTSPDIKRNLLRSVISTDQQLIVMYLSLKRLNAVKIHNDLVATLKGEVNSDSTITYYPRK
jgi:hypothetical protein